ncbi:MAG: translation initiation factor [Muribaculaceae bacterium]|nr:translation initiation factor [Muribaculaceae bacterium]MDE6299854.1 translation initiation factor [Muribaculaceae bacterium]
MNIDWKDALSALRDSGEIPVDNTPEPEEDVSTDSDTIQKSPLTIVTDKKGRKGKVATIIEGFECSESRLEEIAKILKQKLGTGGSIREGEILIQGDRKQDVTATLKSLGFKVK